MDLLCKKCDYVCWERSESTGSSCSLCRFSCRRVTVDRYTSHESFSRTISCDHKHIVVQGVFGSLHLHVIHDVTCERALLVLVLSSFLSLSLASIPVLSFTVCLFSVLLINFRDVGDRRGLKPTALTHSEEYCPVATYNTLTGYEPKLLDNFDYSETSAVIFQDESGDVDTEPSYSCDGELDDEMIGKIAIFTTVHSGARRTSEPETNLSLS